MSKKKVGPELPEGTKKGGKANNDLPESVRTPSKTASVGEGPNVGEKGEYLPATYKTHSGVIRTDN